VALGLSIGVQPRALAAGAPVALLARWNGRRASDKVTVIAQ